MGLGVVVTIAVNIIITIVLLTLFLYFYNLSFECDAYPSPQCKTDWKCSGFAPDSDSIVMVNSLGYGVSNRMMSCYLNALYGVDIEKNEYGEDCRYTPTPDNPNEPGPRITARSMTTMSDEIIPGVSVACNADGGVKVTPDSPTANWTPMAITGLYQNVFSATGKNSAGLSPATPCATLVDGQCVTVSQLMSLSASSNDKGSNFFTDKIGSCRD